MSKRTRLFQPTGSPLILGESKTERPWTTSFVGAYLIGIGIFSCGVMLLAFSSGLTATDALTVTMRRLISVGSWAGALGAALGVSIVRAWGARRGWFAGAVICVLTILLVEGLVVLL